MPFSEAQDDSVIECRVTPWFYRRMALLAGMFLVFAGLFFKDGMHSWPQENEMAAKQEWFDTEVLQAYDKAKTAGELSQWAATAKSQDLPVNADGTPVKWAAYAAARGWPEKPKSHSPGEIEQQYYWGGAMALAALLVGVNVLFSRNRKLVGHAGHLVTPGGRRVAFADAFRVDKRKWAVKGLASVFYREGGQGPEKKAVIDDLKFGGAGKVLDRLLANFKGELIDKAPDPEEPGTAAGSDLQA
jgi:hypothetical protein